MSSSEHTTSATVDRPTPAVADLIWDIEIVEKKLVDLASAVPESIYHWGPEGVRSIREVLLHVAANNYVLPAHIGFTPPAATGITTDAQTVAAFETRNLSKDSAIAELKASFVFLKQSLQSATPESMAALITLFGQQFTGLSWWLLAVTHLHENLGQLIAYARGNGVKPPWS